MERRTKLTTVEDLINLAGVHHSLTASVYSHGNCWAEQVASVSLANGVKHDSVHLRNQFARYTCGYFTKMPSSALKNAIRDEDTYKLICSKMYIDQLPNGTYPCHSDEERFKNTLRTAATKCPHLRLKFQ